MNLEFLQKTDAELMELAEHRETTRDAKKEIQRRKAVGSWRLLANWQPEKEVETSERVYAPGVRRR